MVNTLADIDFDSAGNIDITELDNNHIQVFMLAEWHIHVIAPGNQSSSESTHFDQ